MMKGDAVILLDSLKNALLEFSEKLNPYKDTDSGYGNYLKDLLIHTAYNYERLKGELNNIPDITYRSLYVFLPGNVPMVFFEILPISVIFRINTFFKYPKTEQRLYNNFQSYVRLRYPDLSRLFDGKYLGHKEAEEKINSFDFVFFFGSERLIPLLKRARRPFKFFGPGFSIGVAFSDVSEGIVNDALYFDQKGCLSMRFLFYREEHIKNTIVRIFKNRSRHIPPETRFSGDRFNYFLLTLSQYGKILFKEKCTALVDLQSDTLPAIPLPDRTLILKKIDAENDIVVFLREKTDFLQAVATDRKEKLELLKTHVSFISDFGKLQYQPYNFFFKKGTNLQNIFREDNHDYKMV